MGDKSEINWCFDRIDLTEEQVPESQPISWEIELDFHPYLEQYQKRVLRRRQERALRHRQRRTRRRQQKRNLASKPTSGEFNYVYSRANHFKGTLNQLQRFSRKNDSSHQQVSLTSEQEAQIMTKFREFEQQWTLKHQSKPRLNFPPYYRLIHRFADELNIDLKPLNLKPGKKISPLTKKRFAKQVALNQKYEKLWEQEYQNHDLD